MSLVPDDGGLRCGSAPRFGGDGLTHSGVGRDDAPDRVAGARDPRISLVWYALHVASNCERQVADRLEEAAVENYYPHLIAKSRDGRRDIEKKFFPGYLFARFTWTDRTPVVRIPQVIQILGFTRSHPVPIPEIEIEAVRSLISLAPATVQPCSFWAAGEHVRIKSGPLRDLTGFVVYSKAGSARVVVSVTMLARSISAEVDAGALEVIAAVPAAA